MSSLYQYTEQYRQVADMLEEDEFSIEAIFDTLDSINEDMATKVEHVGNMIRNHEANKKALEDEAKRLKERAAAEGKKMDALIKSVDSLMAKAGFEKLQGLKHTFNYSVTNSLVCTDVRKLPKHFQKPQEPTADIAGMKAFIKKKYEEKGFKLVAKMPAKPKGGEMLFEDLNEDLAAMGIQFKIKRELNLKSK